MTLTEDSKDLEDGIKSLSVSYTPGPKVIPFKHEWTIENFRLQWFDMGKELKSKTFSTQAPNGEVKWCLTIQKKDYHKDYVSVFLTLVDSQKPVLANKKFSVLNAERKPTNAKGGTAVSKHEPKNSDSWGFKEFIRWDYLSDQSNGLLPGGYLTIVCEGNVIIDESTTS